MAVDTVSNHGRLSYERNLCVAKHGRLRRTVPQMLVSGVAFYTNNEDLHRTRFQCVTVIVVIRCCQTGCYHCIAVPPECSVLPT